MRLFALGLAGILALGAGVRPEAADPSPTDLARAVQRKYEGIRDFSADFVHRYKGGVLRKQLVEKGRLLVKKPGMMRWEYTTPEPKQFVSDGVKLYSYIPADKQVIVSAVPDEPEATTPALFLAGKGNLMRDFTASGFFSSQMGVKDIGYIGNVARPEWKGCPPEALKHLGVG